MAAIGTISTLFVIFYFSRKGMKVVTVDIETKVLNDLDEKMHSMKGELTEYWKNSVHPEKWFDPAFQDFIDNEIIKQNKL